MPSVCTLIWQYSMPQGVSWILIFIVRHSLSGTRTPIRESEKQRIHHGFDMETFARRLLAWPASSELVLCFCASKSLQCIQKWYLCAVKDCTYTDYFWNHFPPHLAVEIKNNIHFLKLTSPMWDHLVWLWLLNIPCIPCPKSSCYHLMQGLSGFVVAPINLLWPVAHLGLNGFSDL